MKHKLKGYMWCGVLVNTAAMVLVGSTSFFTADVDSSARDPRCDNPKRRVERGTRRREGSVAPYQRANFIHFPLTILPQHWNPLNPV